jgi:two-component system, OmpR family, sensor histidine kinase KdpD
MRSRALVWAAMPFALALVTTLGKVAGANAPTISSFYLVVVLGLAAWGGWAFGATSSVAAMLCFNYFFLPPFGTLTIAEPANWVALVSFLVASTFASRLVATARREAEEARQLAVERERLLSETAHLEAVRESEALKTSLLRAVSHDLRTPLTAMRLEIESLDWLLADRPEAQAILRGLAVEQGRLARRIDNLLAMARLEAGLARPHPEAVPASDLLRAARESLSPILAGRPVETRVEPHCPDLWADPSLTLEVVANLLENAARLSPSDRLLELAACAEPPERVRVEVLDRGPGVPEGVKRLLQGPLELGGSGDSVSGGLGLQIARSLTEANGGFLALLDRPGGGTIARLTLPAAPELPEPEEVEA